MHPQAAALAAGDGRIPSAWHHREQNFHHSQQRPWSPSSTTTGSEETSSEVETSVSGRVYNPLTVPPMYDRTHTIRSTHSVPALNAMSTFDGEPCPVHGGHLPLYGPPIHPMHLPPPGPFPPPASVCPTMKRGGSMFDVRASPYYQPAVYSSHPMPAYMSPLASQTLEKNSHYGSLHSLHSVRHCGGAAVSTTPMPPPYTLPPMPPTHLLPPGMRPRPMVIPAAMEATPLPVRDPSKAKLSATGILGPGKGLLPTKTALQDSDVSKKQFHCCRGPLPLVWFILSIVTCGVVLGVVLGSIYG